MAEQVSYCSRMFQKKVFIPDGKQRLSELLQDGRILLARGLERNDVLKKWSYLFHYILKSKPMKQMLKNRMCSNLHSNGLLANII